MAQKPGPHAEDGFFSPTWPQNWPSDLQLGSAGFQPGHGGFADPVLALQGSQSMASDDIRR